MSNPNRPAYEIALILIINALHYAKTKDRVTDFFWISKKTYRRISRRVNIQDVHIQVVTAQLSSLGWCVAVLPGDQGYVLFRAKAFTDEYRKLGTKRLKDEAILDMDCEDLEEFYSNLTDEKVELEPIEAWELEDDES